MPFFIYRKKIIWCIGQVLDLVENVGFIHVYFHSTIFEMYIFLRGSQTACILWDPGKTSNLDAAARIVHAAQILVYIYILNSLVSYPSRAEFSSERYFMYQFWNGSDEPALSQI